MIIEVLIPVGGLLLGWLVLIERRLSRIEGKLHYIERLILDGFNHKTKAGSLR